MSEPLPIPMSDEASYYVDWTKVANDPDDESDVSYVRCPRCKGSGVDPDSTKSHQDDEWDCIECHGYGDIPNR